MTQIEFEKLIKKDQYQVFVFSSNCSFPVTPARHAWFVVNNKGTISRWEILFNKNETTNSWGHLYKDYLPPTVGMKMIRFAWSPYWEGQLLAAVDGAENSDVHKLVELIESSPNSYPHNDNYNMIMGPNSNGYIGWVLRQFPELGIELPWNCLGKNYFKNK